MGHYRLRHGAILLGIGCLLVSVFGCSQKPKVMPPAPGSSTAGIGAPGAPASDPSRAGRPSNTEIEARLKQVQSDSSLSPEAKALLTKQMQSAMNDPRTPK